MAKVLLTTTPTTITTTTTNSFDKTVGNSRNVKQLGLEMSQNRIVNKWSTPNVMISLLQSYFVVGFVVPSISHEVY